MCVIELNIKIRPKTQFFTFVSTFVPFVQDDFDVDQFVAECRKQVQLEEMREDLELYYKLLKTAMVELINKDYADFVNLSTNLVSCLICSGSPRTRKCREGVKCKKQNVLNKSKHLRLLS